MLRGLCSAAIASCGSGRLVLMSLWLDSCHDFRTLFFFGWRPFLFILTFLPVPSIF